MSGFAVSFGLAIDILLIAVRARWADNFALDRLVRLFCWPLADLTGGHGQLNGLHSRVLPLICPPSKGRKKVSLNSALGLN